MTIANKQVERDFNEIAMDLFKANAEQIALLEKCVRNFDANFKIIDEKLKAFDKLHSLYHEGLVVLDRDIKRLTARVDAMAKD